MAINPIWFKTGQLQVDSQFGRMYNTMASFSDFTFYYMNLGANKAGDYVYNGTNYNTDTTRATKNTNGDWVLHDKSTISPTGYFTFNIFQLNTTDYVNQGAWVDNTSTLLPISSTGGFRFFFKDVASTYLYASFSNVLTGQYTYDADSLTLRQATKNANGDWVLHTGATISPTGLYTAPAYAVSSSSTSTNTSTNTTAGTTTNTTTNNNTSSSTTTGTTSGATGNTTSTSSTSTSTNTTSTTSGTTKTINQIMDPNLTSAKGVIDADGIAEALSILTSITSNSDQIKLEISKGAVKISLADNVKFADLTADEAFTRVVSASEKVSTATLNVTGESTVKKINATEVDSSGNANVGGDANVSGKVKASYVETDYVLLKPYPANAVPTNLPPYAMFAIQK